MKKKFFMVPLLVAAALVLASVACNFQLPGPEESFDLPADVPEDIPAATEEEPLPSEGEMPETEPEPEVAPPASAWLPPGTIALVRSGTWASASLKAAAADATITDLGVTLYGASSVSLSGRWVASADSPAPAANIQIINLESSITYSIPITPGYTIYGTAFDQDEQRLAFMELGASGGTYLWGIVVVNLADGSTTRFDTSFAIGSHPAFLPGRPVGWNAAGDLLILDTFMPDTEGNWAGVWGVAVPPGAASADLDTLAAVSLVPMGGYLTEPVLSRDGTHLLYLNRDYGYTPAGYVVMAYDLVVNELWDLNLTTNTATPYIDASDGSALMRGAGWSMDGSQILYGQGSFSGGADFTAMGLKTYTGGVSTAVGPAAIPAGGAMQQLAWCRPGTGLATARQSGGDSELQVIDMLSGGSVVIADVQQAVDILGCVP
ncbi:MAG: hypothetical protein JXA25_02405 [Anaerolineales bacterium]|nr:hypothetical protein [Anaerolineales bacterium]